MQAKGLLYNALVEQALPPAFSQKGPSCYHPILWPAATPIITIFDGGPARDRFLNDFRRPANLNGGLFHLLTTYFTTWISTSASSAA